MHEADPRRVRGHRERGPKKLIFTLEEVVKLQGVKLRTVYGKGELYEDLEYLFQAILRGRVHKRRRALEPKQFIGAISEEGSDPRSTKWLARWNNRWPRLQAYCCLFPSCSKAVLGGVGLCVDHGKPSWRFGLHGHFELRVASKFIPFHRLVADPPKGLMVHHIDYNLWNNRRSNLHVMSFEDHHRYHRFPPEEREQKMQD